MPDETKPTSTKHRLLLTALFALLILAPFAAWYGWDQALVLGGLLVFFLVVALTLRSWVVFGAILGILLARMGWLFLHPARIGSGPRRFPEPDLIEPLICAVVGILAGALLGRVHQRLRRKAQHYADLRERLAIRDDVDASLIASGEA